MKIRPNLGKYVVAAGTLMDMTCSLLGSAFSMPRCAYTTAKDGLLIRFLAMVNGNTQTPVIAVGVFGLLSSLLALFLDIDTLVEFMSIGTPLAYTVVAASIIVLCPSNNVNFN